MPTPQFPEYRTSGTLFWQQKVKHNIAAAVHACLQQAAMVIYGTKIKYKQSLDIAPTLHSWQCQSSWYDFIDANSRTERTSMNCRICPYGSHKCELDPAGVQVASLSSGPHCLITAPAAANQYRWSWKDMIACCNEASLETIFRLADGVNDGARGRIETILYLRLAGTYDHFMAHNERKFNAT